jgi:RNA polymerase sigma factor (sigma-70 family)
LSTIKEILNNRNQGLKWLYEKFGRKLLGYSISVYKIEEDAGWDLVYKTLYRILDVVNDYEFENEQKLGSFIFKVFINYLKNHIRDEKTRTQGAQFISLEESRTDFSAKGEKQSLNPHMSSLKEELDKLEDWQRILLLMRSQDMSYAEIAKYVDKPETQLKVYYQRLKNALAERMKAKLKEKEALRDATQP